MNPNVLVVFFAKVMDREGVIGILVFMLSDVAVNGGLVVTPHVFLVATLVASAFVSVISENS
mgnify:CR=1 FL=1